MITWMTKPAARTGPRLSAAATALLLLATLVAGAPAHVAASHTVDVTAKITYVDVLDDGLDGTGRGEADLYAGFAIGTSEFRDCGTFDGHPHGQTELRPDDWVCSTAITVQNDSLPGFTNVDLQIWDHDDCDDPFCTDTGELESNDDQADVSPGSNFTLSLSVSLATGKWTSAGGTTDADWPRNCAEGSGESAVKICFDISIDSSTGDADGDGLLDGWERNGYNADGDATIDLDLPTIGTDPFKKDLLLELDCLVAADHTHCPIQAALQDVILGFANAPVINPDGSWGIQLHVDIGNIYGQALNAGTAVARTEAPATNGAVGHFGNYGSTTSIAEGPNMVVDFDGATGNAGVDIKTIRAANMDAKRFLVMRYGLFGHQTNSRQAVNDCTSGLAKGDLFMVTLGGVSDPVPPGGTPLPCWTVQPGTSQSVGNEAEQAGTLMHEYGHSLSLGHGGGDGYNLKPNYFSVMNYAWQSCAVPPVPGILVPGGCDFSRIALDTLKETSLDECKGLGNGLPPVNWNKDGNFSGPFYDGTTCDPTSPNVTANVNNDTSADSNGDEVQNGSEPPVLSDLPGYDDWDHIQYRLNANGGGAGGAGEIDPTPEMIEAAQAAMADLFRTAIDVDKTGPADGAPGDTLSYSINATNTSRNGVWANGPAMSASLDDTKPDGSTVQFSLGTIVAGGSATRTTSFDVACDTADGTVLTNSVSFTASDLLGNPDSASDSVTTTIHAPVMTLAKTATASVNAGEAITYSLTYENTGSAAASEVTITDTLPAGIYYSVALDAGAGPTPTTVTPNADGTTTLTWSIGALAAGTGPQSIEYTARPTLLFLGGETLTNSATLTFENANGCAYEADEQSASTAITVVPATRDPLSMGYWRTHPADWSSELLARIQATDQRFDGADGSTPDGLLSTAEVAAVMAPSGNGVRVLQQQLTATYLNLASRRINAATLIDSRLTRKLALANVRDAAVYAQATLALPLTKATNPRYGDATTVLDQVNTNRIEVY